MKNSFFRYLLVVCFAVNVQAEETMKIDSQHADFNGQLITLQGHVVIEHELGTLAADHVELLPEKCEKKIRAKQLDMTDNVIIKLKEGGQLCCSTAQFNFESAKGKFRGDPEKEFVTYSETFNDSTSSKIPLVVKSRTMTFTLAKANIDEITADRDVTVNYNNDFIAASDHAAYHRQTELDIHSRMPGLISLRAEAQEGVCQITNRNGDIISADHLCIDTTRRTLSFAYPKGALYLGQEDKGQHRLDFSSDTLTWEEAKDVLILQEHVNLHQQGIGTLVTNESIMLTQELIEGKKRLSTIKSSGTTLLTYAEPDKDIAHELTCHGTVFVDHKNLKAVLESPKDADGNVAREQQIYFLDYMGEIYADKMTIEYAAKEHGIKPVQFILEGHVRILNRGAVDPESRGPFTQFALADTVVYSTQAKEISLSADAGNRVLFLDKLNNLQISAPSLKIRRDETTKKESVQGIGNVRFNFLKQESDAFQQFVQ